MCLDANQAQHNPVLGGGWIKLRRWITLRGNTGRRRLNINGVIDVETQRALIRDDSIDAASTIALFTQIEAAYPKAYRVTVFCDNACY